mgnify:FL=1
MRDGGHLQTGKVISFTYHVVGQETGFLGEIAILALTYSSDAKGESSDPAPPATMVLKIPTPLKNRVMGQSLGVYEKEIRFYSTLKEKLNIRTPGFYYGAMSATDDPDVILERLKALNRLPIWLIAIFGLIVQWIYGLMPRRYALLIEDVSHYRLGDQSAVCSDDDIKMALDSMASLHAQFWDNEELQSLSWVTPIELSAKLIHMGYLQSATKYLKENAASLTEDQLKLHAWLKNNGVALTERLGKKPVTLLHGDFRVDNLCFDDNSGEMLLLDWQTTMAGSYALELAYFLSTALPADASREKLDEMIEYYRHAIGLRGIQITTPALRREFDIGMIAIVHRISPILYQSQLELGTDRGPAIMQNWIDSAYQKAIDIELESILDAP